MISRTCTKKLCLAAFLAITICHLAAAQSQIILGVLEDGPVDPEGPQNPRRVRALFRKNGSEWQPYPSDCPDQPCLKSVTASYPREVTWTVAFDGRELGQITSRTPSNFEMYWRVGQQEIASNTPAPTVGKRSLEFGGFLDAEVYRPLVTISQPNFKDPAVWKPAVLPPPILNALRQQFRQKFPKMCKSSKDETHLVPFPYSDDDLKLVKSYASKTGWRLVRLRLQAIDCSDSNAGFDIDDPWFVIDEKGSVRYLDSGMFLVDAGDYDNDGKSEIVFSIVGDNIGGYRIFYDDFRKKAEFKFSYH